jgi:RNA polymerase sigma factor (sigma-70 family)
MEQMPGPESRVADKEAATSGESFEAFFREEHSRLLRALYLVGGNRQEAEEIMQEAFLRIWERWGRVRAMANPIGYLYRTALNLLRSRHRRALVMAKRALGAEVGRDEFAAADERDVLARAMARLTPRQRAALVVTEYLGYSSEDAAAVLGIKAVTVRVLASQARDALRSTMEPTDE